MEGEGDNQGASSPKADPTHHKPTTNTHTEGTPDISPTTTNLIRTSTHTSITQPTTHLHLTCRTPVGQTRSEAEEVEIEEKTPNDDRMRETERMISIMTRVDLRSL